MKTILITGASSGIGKATVQLFALKGWNVIATMRKREVAAELQNTSNVHSYLLDVTDLLSIQSVVNQIIQNEGQVDVLLNNAGVYDTAPLECMPKEAVERLIETNIKGTVYVTQALIPHFRENKSGMIVNISSIAGRTTFPFQSVYHLTKWAIEGFSEGLRYELRNMNIQVKSIAPGSVKTNLWKDLNKKSEEKYPSLYKQTFERWFRYLNNNIQIGIKPEKEALYIYKAVTDGKDKLHYSPEFNTRLAILLHFIFPLNLYQRIICRLVKL